MTPDMQRMMLYDANKKSVGVAYLLWFVFGMFGAHRFYAGNSGSGAVILILTILSLLLSVTGIGLVTIFIPALWVLIDVFLVPGMVRNHNMKLAMNL